MKVAGEDDRQEALLIQQSIVGDRSAFSQLVIRYQRFELSIAYRMAGDADGAEDIAQEAFVKAWLNLGRFRGDSPFRSWLARIVVNASVDWLRRRRPETMLPDDHPARQESLPALALRRERSDRVREAILALPANSRAALVLREYEELSYREIAEILDIPIGTVMSRLNYARGLLRAALAPEYEEYGRTAEGERRVAE